MLHVAHPSVKFNMAAQELGKSMGILRVNSSIKVNHPHLWILPPSTGQPSEKPPFPPILRVARLRHASAAATACLEWHDLGVLENGDLPSLEQ